MRGCFLLARRMVSLHLTESVALTLFCTPTALAQQGLFDSEPFLKCVLAPTSSHSPPSLRLKSDPRSPPSHSYLTYLLYFRQPRYSRFLQYPQSLHHLTLLTSSSSFRKALKEQPLLAQEWAGKMVAHWAGWREREGLGEAVGGLAGEGGKTEDGAGAGEAAAIGGAAERNGGDEVKEQAVAAS